MRVLLILLLALTACNKVDKDKKEDKKPENPTDEGTPTVIAQIGGNENFHKELLAVKPKPFPASPEVAYQSDENAVLYMADFNAHAGELLLVLDRKDRTMRDYVVLDTKNNLNKIKEGNLGDQPILAELNSSVVWHNGDVRALTHIDDALHFSKNAGSHWEKINQLHTRVGTDYFSGIDDVNHLIATDHKAETGYYTRINEQGVRMLHSINVSNGKSNSAEPLGNMGIQIAKLSVMNQRLLGKVQTDTVEQILLLVPTTGHSLSLASVPSGGNLWPSTIAQSPSGNRLAFTIEPADLNEPERLVITDQNLKPLESIDIDEGIALTAMEEFILLDDRTLLILTEPAYGEDAGPVKILKIKLGD